MCTCRAWAELRFTLKLKEDIMAKRHFIGLIVALGILSTAPAGAQSTFGSIVGVVRDPAQLVVLGATVTLRSLDDNNARTVKVGSDGAFEFVNLKPGAYSLTAKAQGFADFLVSAAQLEARQTLRIDVALAVKSETVTIEVNEAATAINTENAVLANSMDNKDINQLPLNSRAVSTSPLAALGLSSNVQQDSQGNLALGGANASMVGYSVDGISTANVRQNGALQDAYPSIEGIAELKVTDSNNNAEFAQVGDVTFTTKSGGNQLHGSLFEYLQNDALDATIYGFGQKAPKRFNTFGGSLGGPVTIPKLYHGKDRTFFFIDFEGNRKRTDTPMRYLVPTAAQRAGDLSALPNPNGALIDPTTNQPFAGNAIPLLRMNATAQTLLNDYYPLPNVAGNSGYNYQTLQPIPANTNGFDVRLDQTISSKQQIYARLSWKNVQADAANPLLPNDVDTEHNRSLLVSHNYTITPRIVNEFRFGFTSTLVDVNFPIGGGAAISQLGLQGIDISQHPNGEAFPTFNFSDGTGFTPIGRDRPGITQSNTDQFTDNLTIVKGKHTLRFGVDVRRVHYQDLMFFEPSDDYGLFTFNQGVFTGSSYGDFLLGLPNTSFFAITSPPGGCARHAVRRLWPGRVAREQSADAQLWFALGATASFYRRDRRFGQFHSCYEQRSGSQSARRYARRHTILSAGLQWIPAVLQFLHPGNAKYFPSLHECPDSQSSRINSRAAAIVSARLRSTDWCGVPAIPRQQDRRPRRVRHLHGHHSWTHVV
jgi:hypothetical protein